MHRGRGTPPAKTENAMLITKKAVEFLDSAKRRGSLGAIIFTMAAVCWSAQGSQSVALAWDADAGPYVAGYIVHYGVASGVYTNSLDVGTNINATVPGLQEGATYYFAVTAYNTDGLESNPSNEISFQVPVVFHITGPSLQLTPSTPLGGPTLIQFLGSASQTYELQASADLQAWSTIWYSLPQTTSQLLEYQDLEAANSPLRFYRLIVH